MKAMRIPKGNGTFRTVWSPTRGERRRCERVLPDIMAAQRRLALAMGVPDVAHGFVAGRSPVTCALAHVGFAVSICCDLAGWFDSVTQEQVRVALELADADPALASVVCWQGHPVQGLPTSPAACNLTAVSMDWDIQVELRRLLGERVRFVCTRYADDLTVSLAVDSDPLVSAVISLLARCAGRMGWQIASHKTRIQHRSAGRRVIVGVSVGATDIQAPRWMRRKLRAARHQDRRSDHARGLAEWCKMKLPRAARPAWSILTGSPPVEPALAERAAMLGLDLAQASERAVFCDLLADTGEDDSVLRTTLVPPGM